MTYLSPSEQLKKAAEILARRVEKSNYGYPQITDPSLLKKFVYQGQNIENEENQKYLKQLQEEVGYKYCEEGNYVNIKGFQVFMSNYII